MEQIRSLVSKLTLKEVIDIKNKANDLFKEQEESTILKLDTDEARQEAIHKKEVYEKELESARKGLKDMIPELTEEQKQLLYKKLDESIREELVLTILKLDKDKKYEIEKQLIKLVKDKEPKYKENTVGIKEKSNVEVKKVLLYAIPIITSLIIITKVIRKVSLRNETRRNR